MDGRNFVLILAAGASTRMGVCKASLPWSGGKTLLVYQAEQALGAGFVPVIVLGPHNRDRLPDCPSGCLTVVNPNPDLGKTSSILAGLQCVPEEVEVVAIAAVDQPRPADVYQTLLQAHRHHSAKITVPSYQGRLGHPLLFSRELRSHLENICEASWGLRQVLNDFRVELRQVEFHTSIVLADLNTPESYQAARSQFLTKGEYYSNYLDI